MAVEPLQNGRIVPIENKKSILEENVFNSVKDKAQNWLSTSAGGFKNQMDSVYFHNDRFELLVDARGFRPEDIKCTINSNTIEVTGQTLQATGGGQRTLSTSRNYQLPRTVVPQQAICCLSSEGMLLVAVPWQK